MKSLEDMKTSYYEYVEEYRIGYEMTASLIGYVVQRMKEASIINGEITISGRIKSFKSAYENTGKKAVDDCFGLRIMGNRDDLIKIEQQLRQFLVIDETKDHRKKTNTKYNALHEMVHLHNNYGEQSKGARIFPEIEIQYWNEEVSAQCIQGELSYANYKKRDLPAILEGLDTNPESVYADLPICYEIKGKDIRVLSSKEALYKLYPEIKELEEKRDKVRVTQDDDELYI